jgi:hypothetical protein
MIERHQALLDLTEGAGHLDERAHLDRQVEVRQSSSLNSATGSSPGRATSVERRTPQPVQ